MRIFKYPLVMKDVQIVVTPKSAALLDVQMQRGTPCLWAICDELAGAEHRRIAIYGTGNPLPHNPGVYIATFQMDGGSLVFHAFDLGAVQ